jgi:hypothetical protein
MKMAALAQVCGCVSRNEKTLIEAGGRNCVGARAGRRAMAAITMSTSIRPDPNALFCRATARFRRGWHERSPNGLDGWSDWRFSMTRYVALVDGKPGSHIGGFYETNPNFLDPSLLPEAASVPMPAAGSITWSISSTGSRPRTVRYRFEILRQAPRAWSARFLPMLPPLAGGRGTVVMVSSNRRGGALHSPCATGRMSIRRRRAGLAGNKTREWTGG